MTIKSLLAGGMIMLLFACGSPEKLVSDASKDRIYFGKAGGFTNISSEYLLVEKYIYKREGEKFNLIRKLSGDQVKDINNLVNAIDFGKLNLNEPGIFLGTRNKGRNQQAQITETIGISKTAIFIFLMHFLHL